MSLLGRKKQETSILCVHSSRIYGKEGWKTSAIGTMRTERKYGNVQAVLDLRNAEGTSGTPDFS
jgi:hypothetical protein